MGQGKMYVTFLLFQNIFRTDDLLETFIQWNSPIEFPNEVSACAL